MVGGRPSRGVPWLALFRLPPRLGPPTAVTGGSDATTRKIGLPSVLVSIEETVMGAPASCRLSRNASTSAVVDVAWSSLRSAVVRGSGTCCARAGVTASAAASTATNEKREA